MSMIIKDEPGPASGNSALGIVVLPAYPLEIVCEADTPIALPGLLGPVLRGSLLEGLYRRFCANPAASTCRDCPLHRACPVSRLVATVRDAGVRGVDVPRPFALRPPLLPSPRLTAGDEFRFGLSLFGHVAYLPYILQALEEVGASGIGKRGEAPGRFHVREMWLVNDLAGTARRVWDSSQPSVRLPDGAVTHAAVLDRARELVHGRRVRLQFLTPLRLVSDGRLVHTFSLDALLRRTLRRLSDLQAELCGAPLDLPYESLLLAAAAHVARDETRWLDAESHSGRTGKTTPIGGLVGTVSLGGDLEAVLPWLLWAQVVGVGKDVTKGNGWIRVEVG